MCDKMKARTVAGSRETSPLCDAGSELRRFFVSSHPMCCLRTSVFLQYDRTVTFWQQKYRQTATPDAGLSTIRPHLSTSQLYLPPAKTNAPKYSRRVRRQVTPETTHAGKTIKIVERRSYALKPEIGHDHILTKIGNIEINTLH